jgi:hypothetical protein
MYECCFGHSKTLGKVLNSGAQANALAAVVALKEFGVPDALIGTVSAGRGRRAYVKLVCIYYYVGIFCWSSKKHRARYLIVVPRPMSAAPLRYLIVAARRSPAAVVCQGT